MYELRERSAQEIADEKLIRVSEHIEEKAHFNGPYEDRIMLDFGERGVLPLWYGDIYRSRSREADRDPKGFRDSVIYFELTGFDHAHYGKDEAVVSGFWGPEWRWKQDFRRGIDRKRTPLYMGSTSGLPSELFLAALDLLDGEAGVDFQDYQRREELEDA